ncbi:MAG: hypothetical protein ABFE07_29665 [Armatimonadia bacterium]
MLLYKLTDATGQTHGGCQWGEGVTHTAPGGGALCTKAWIHAYTSPLLAVLLNPIHGRFTPEAMRLWECEGGIGATDHGLKVGCTSLTTIREIPVPQVSCEQWVSFAILCAKEVCTDDGWTEWAGSWLDGDRSQVKSEWAAWTRASAWDAWAQAEADSAEWTETTSAWAEAESETAAAWAQAAAAALAEAETAEQEAQVIQAATKAVLSAVQAAKLQGKSIDLVALAYEIQE